jgi:hypothetical protein
VPLLRTERCSKTGRSDYVRHRRRRLIVSPPLRYTKQQEATAHHPLRRTRRLLRYAGPIVMWNVRGTEVALPERRTRVTVAVPA